MKVNNMAPWAKNRKFLVVCRVDGELWFYDAWDDHDKAVAQAMEECVQGMVIPASEAVPA